MKLADTVQMSKGENHLLFFFGLELEKYIRQGSMGNKKEILLCCEDIFKINKIDKIGN